MATGLNSIGFLVAALRVIQNEHYVQDVVVGGLVGILFSSFFYCLQNYFGIYKKKPLKKKVDISFAPSDKDLGLKIVLKY